MPIANTGRERGSTTLLTKPAGGVSRIVSSYSIVSLFERRFLCLHHAIPSKHRLPWLRAFALARCRPDRMSRQENRPVDAAFLQRSMYF